MNSLLILNALKIDNSWSDFLSEEMVMMLQKIESQLADDIALGQITPAINKVLRFMELPLQDMKVIILGQDPYPQPGAATGRAFEVGNLKDWQEPFRNASLQNIIRTIVKAKTGELLKFSQIRKQLNRNIHLASPTRLFCDLEEQGVLLLNTAFTCRIDEPASHSAIWKEFTTSLLTYINDKHSDLVWLLWGNHAKMAVDHLKINNSVFSYHPSRCNPRKEDFLYGELNCFKETADLINWFGKSEYIGQFSIF
jgi:uracil-DNA glycosylase